MARERWLFSEKLKREAVKLVNQPGATKAAIARDLGLGPNLLGRWCRETSGETAFSNGNGEKVDEPTDIVELLIRPRRHLPKLEWILDGGHPLLMGQDLINSFILWPKQLSMTREHTHLQASPTKVRSAKSTKQTGRK